MVALDTMEDASVASCLEKLSHFRIKELKDVLSLLKLSKQGKKQDLVERIKTALSNEPACKISAKKRTQSKEDVIRLIENTYRKMQGTTADDSATMGNNVSDNNSLWNSEDAAIPLKSEIKIRCICKNPSSTESIIKCDDKKCGIWQHLGCVILPDKPGDAAPDPPEKFYCELCRLTRADPFLQSLANPLNPVPLVVKKVPVDGSSPFLYLEKSFQLTRADRDMLSKQEYDVQAWCMLVNDKVVYRMQWPQHAVLCVNGMPVSATNRPGPQVLGSNGRDDGAIITPCTRDGSNIISLEAKDARTFCFGVRLVKRRSLAQIRNSVPMDSDGESFDEALARVQRCTGGGASAEESDCDNELVFVAECHVINLRCPMSGSRIKVAGRFKPCLHLRGFDLDIFLEINQRSRKWQCPICLKNYSLENIIIDPYFNRITSMLLGCSDDITDVDIKPDGCWRVKTTTESERRTVGDLARWHFPNGSYCNLTEGEDIERKAMVLSESATHQNLHASDDIPYDLDLLEDSTPMGINASRSRKDGKDGNGTTDYINSGIEYDSVVLLNPDPAEKNKNSYAEVIELSDSDDDEITIVTEAVHESGLSGDFNLPVSNIPSSLSGDYRTVYKVSDCGIPFDSEADCHTGLFDHSSAVSTPGPYTTGPFRNGDIAPGTSGETDVFGTNPVSLNEADPYYDARNQLNASNGNHSDDWISRRLGDFQSDDNKAPTSSNQVLLPENNADDCMDSDAALLLHMSNGGSDRTNRPISDNSFSCPRRNRSVRRRIYRSIGSD